MMKLSPSWERLEQMPLLDMQFRYNITISLSLHFLFESISASNTILYKCQDLWQNQYCKNRHQGHDGDIHGRQEQRGHVEGELGQVHDVDDEDVNDVSQVLL